jgi:DNA-binding beta-propeller fold protein YncE
MAQWLKPACNAPGVAFVAALSLCAMFGCERRTSGPDSVVALFGEPGLAWGAFAYPRAIAVDSTDHVYVADKSGRIQCFNPNGEFNFGWKMPETQSGKPIGLTIHPDGRIFVADTHYHRVMIFERDGDGVREVGRFGEHGEGPGQFLLVTDVAIDADGLIYVSEYGGNDRITVWSPQLTYVRAFGDTPVNGARLSRPAGLAFDGNHTLWVADACNHRIVGFDRSGQVVGVFGSVGRAAGQFRWPYDVSVCSDGTLLVSEFGNHRVQVLSVAGEPVRAWGTAGRDRGQLNSPWGAVQASSGHVFVLDSINNRVQVIDL